MRSMKKFSTDLKAGGFAAALLILLAAPGTASAAIDSTQHQFSVQMLAGCIVDVTGLDSDLGVYPLGSAPVDLQIGSVAVTCSQNTVYNLGISAGEHFDGAERGLQTPGGGRISYTLRTDHGPLGDNGLSASDPAYQTTTPNMNGYGVRMHPGGGAADVTNISANVDLPDATAAGDYTDTVNIVVVW